MIYDDLNLYTSKNVNFQRGVFAIHFIFAYMNPKITHVIVETAPQRHARCMGMGQNWVSFNVSESPLYFFGWKKMVIQKRGQIRFEFFVSQVNARRKLKHLAEFGLKMLVTPRRFAAGRWYHGAFHFSRHGCHGCHGAQLSSSPHGWPWHHYDM